MQDLAGLLIMQRSWCSSPVRAALVAFFCSSLSHASNTSSAGSSGCPCLEWADMAKHRVNGVTLYKPLGSLISLKYPGDYGNMVCKAHDANLAPSCNWGDNDSPQWCKDKWCWVDPKKCDTAFSKSRFFADVDNLYFSYATCAGPGGSSNQFDQWEIAGVDGTTMLLDLLHGYLRGSRAQIETAYRNISDWSVIKDCGYSSTCPCLSCKTNSYWKQKIDLSDVGVWTRNAQGDDGTQIKCLSKAIASTYLKVAAKESDAAGSNVGYQYFAQQSTGGYAQWPNAQWCPAQTWDPRLRPWYTSASTGPKDVVIVVDVSGSMQNGGRSALARVATKAILDTLSWMDFATIVLFESQVHSTFSNTMVSMTELQRNAMKRWVDSGDWENGGTNFVSALFQDDGDGKGAFPIIRDSVAMGTTSMCQKVIMFLTDGVSSFSNADFVYAKQLATRYDTIFFTYALGSGADQAVPKRLACDNKGMFYPVPDNADLATTMASYYQYFAAGQEMCSASFVEYSDALTSTKLYAGCLPMYDRRAADPALAGVTCMDINMFERMETLKNQSGWQDLVCKMSDMSKMCRPLDLSECNIEKLRRQVGAGSMCGTSDTNSACSCIDRECRDSPTFKDEKGYFCDTWIGDDCNTAASLWGFSASGQAGLLTNCPRSCRTCRWLTPCPYSSSSSCKASASKPPSFCRACMTDKTSGVDIEGCLMSCAAKGEARMCNIIKSSSADGILKSSRIFLSIIIVVLVASTAATQKAF